MTDGSDKPVEKKDPLSGLGKSASKEQTLPDLYSLPEVATYLSFKQKSADIEMQLLSKIENSVRSRYGTKLHENLSTIIRSLANKDLIGHPNLLRVKSELVFGGLAGDKDLRTDIIDDEVKGSS